MGKRTRDAEVEFTCLGACSEDDSPTWMVEGRYNAEGVFEPTEDVTCPECGDSEVEPADAFISWDQA